MIWVIFIKFYKKKRFENDFIVNFLWFNKNYNKFNIINTSLINIKNKKK